MEGKNYRQDGYKQGLEDGTKVTKRKEFEKTIRNVYSKYSHINALEYIAGYIGGFSKSNMISITELWGKSIPTDA